MSVRDVSGELIPSLVLSSADQFGTNYTVSSLAVPDLIIRESPDS